MISALQKRITIFNDLIVEMSELEQLRDRVRKAEVAVRVSQRYLVEAPPIPRPTCVTQSVDTDAQLSAR